MGFPILEEILNVLDCWLADVQLNVKMWTKTFTHHFYAKPQYQNNEQHHTTKLGQLSHPSLHPGVYAPLALTLSKSNSI